MENPLKTVTSQKKPPTARNKLYCVVRKELQLTKNKKASFIGRYNRPDILTMNVTTKRNNRMEPEDI